MYDKLLKQAKKFFRITLGFREFDAIPGGKADEKSIKEFDPDALEKGKAVEMEHTDDEKVSLEIASDHLAEFDEYYEALEQMEKELEQKK